MRLSEVQAQDHFKAYLRVQQHAWIDFDCRFEPFGAKSWLVSSHEKAKHTPIPWRHIINARGKVSEWNLQSLNVLFLNEFAAPLDDKGRAGLIASFIKIHSAESVVVVSKTADIPDHDKAPLDADIAAALRAPFSFGDLVMVQYTYQQIGGVVRRYRFHFADGVRFRRAECLVVGRGIGGALYHE